MFLWTPAVVRWSIEACRPEPQSGGLIGSLILALLLLTGPIAGAIAADLILFLPLGIIAAIFIRDTPGQGPVESPKLEQTRSPEPSVRNVDIRHRCPVCGNAFTLASARRVADSVYKCPHCGQANNVP